MIAERLCAHRWRQEPAPGREAGWDSVCRRCGVRILFRAGHGEKPGELVLRMSVIAPDTGSLDLAAVAYAQREYDCWCEEVRLIAEGMASGSAARPRRSAARAGGR